MTTLTPDGHVVEWFGTLFGELAEAYPNVRIREGTTRRYAEALQDLSPDQIKAAMAAAILECDWFPPVAKIRTFVAPSADDAALLAWVGLLDAAAQVGAYRSLEIADACAAEALVRAAGSWGEFCALEDGPALATVRTGFLAAYRDARRRLRQAPPMRLAGLLEAAGHVSRAPTVWTARLTAGWRIEQVREYPALPAGRDVNRLSNGGPNEEDNDEAAEPERIDDAERP